MFNVLARARGLQLCWWQQATGKHRRFTWFFFFFLENTWFAFVRQPMLVPLLSALALSRVCLGTHPRERGHLKQPVKKIFVPSFFSSYVMELVSI
jgi:hypothetical protein